jgi:hypothetical protein
VKNPVWRYESASSASDSASAADDILSSEVRSRGRSASLFGSISWSGDRMRSFTFCAVSDLWVANTGRSVVRRKWRVRARERPVEVLMVTFRTDHLQISTAQGRTPGGGRYENEWIGGHDGGFVAKATLVLSLTPPFISEA